MSQSTIQVFSGFQEYWHFGRFLSQSQRTKLFKCLSIEEQDRIRQSVSEGGWDDLVFRDSINTIVDEIKNKYNVDMISNRCKVLSGKTVYLPKAAWEDALAAIYTVQPDPRHIEYILGGIEARPARANPEHVIILLQKGSRE